MCLAMKTFLSCNILSYLICVCTCVFGYWEPRIDGSSKILFEENFKKCKDVDSNLTTGGYVGPDTVLCFGFKVFSEQLRKRTNGRPINETADEKSNPGFCQYFEEMKLDSSMEKQNDSVSLYNRQFRNQSWCEKLCLDLMEHVNPLCKSILFLSRHSNEIANESATPLNALPGRKTGSHDNEHNNPKPSSDQKEPLTTIPEKLHSNMTDGQKFRSNVEVLHNEPSNSKASDKKQQTTPITEKHHSKVTAGQKPKSSDPKELHTVENSVSRGSKNAQALTNVKDLSHRLDQKAVGAGGNIEGGKQNISAEAEVPTDQEGKTANMEEPTSKTQNAEGVNIAEITVNMDVGQNKVVKGGSNPADPNSKKTDFSRKVQMVATEDRNSVTMNENMRKSDTSAGNIMEVPNNLSGPMPKKTDGNNNENVPDTAQEKPIVNAQKAGTGSQVTNGNEDKENDDFQDTEVGGTNPPLIDPLDSNTKSKETVKSSINEQKASPITENSDTNANTNTASQSDRSGAQDDTRGGASKKGKQVPEAAGQPVGNTVSATRPILDPVAGDMHEKFGADDSHFFAYFMTTMVFCIVGYLLFHNKQKILALALEGRSRRGRRRPNTSGYRKLDSNLEEAISSSKSSSVTQVIY